MKIAYIPGSEPARCYMSAKAKWIRLGSGLYQNKVKPYMWLCYDFATCAHILTLAKLMEERNIRPQVHIFDLHKAEPEVTVLFRLSTPSRTDLSKILGMRPSDLNALLSVSAPRKFAELMTTAEAACAKLGCDHFLGAFEHSGCASVLLVADELDAPPVWSCEVDEINRARPLFK